MSAESESVEYKPSLSQTDKIVESVSAFSNTKGGRIEIGRKDDGVVVGIQVGKDTIEKLSNQIKQNTDPPTYPSIEVVKTDGKDVIVISVEESPSKPVFAYGRAFKRVGKSNHKLSKDEIRKLMMESSNVYWDEQICKGAKTNDIDEEKVRWFLRKAQSERNFSIDPKIPLIEALEKLKLIADEKLTNASVLLFGKQPQNFFSQAETRCARFKGTEPIEFIDMKVFGGSVIDQRENAVEFVKEHIKLHAKIVGTERVETWEYPIEAIREGISNAICHRDYETPSNVQVRIFDDRVEIWNPGTLAKGLTIDKLKGRHESILRNPLVGKCFFLIKFIEQWGTGTNRIIRETVNHGLPEPVFEDTKTSFVLTFRKYVISEETIRMLNERQRYVLEKIRSEGFVKSIDVQKQFNVTRDTANRDLNHMMELKVIKREGIGKSIRYISV